ncbi:tRNA-specific 2-thiouridylase [Candidatus Saccharibacteria bacterium]|nr:tRNA-specific 2-thiouridylase [Candidatus Saccharibacteria bacterium]
MNKTVFVGMSGGVDSSVAALLLKEQGYKVVGVYMKNWSRDLPGMKCPWAEDLADAKRVAVKLGIDFYVWDFEKEYHDKVVGYMLSEFRKGNTPNPDIMCNQEIKFKLFYEKAVEAGADFIATGHYARTGFDSTFSSAGLENSGTSYAGPPAEPPATRANLSTKGRPLDVASIRNASVSSTRLLQRSGSSGIYVPEFSNQDMLQKKQNSKPLLLRSVDENKDQTYFLYRISEEALSKTIFPIGGMMKPEVKKLAQEKGLHNAYKKESMGVCFVGEVGMKDFLKEYIEIEPGEIREIESEKVLGYHEGAVFYTIGQRHGLYISSDLPYYVVKKDVARNIIYVSKNLNHHELWKKEIKLKDIFIRNQIKNEQVLVRLRHRAPLIPAKFDGETLYFENEVKRPASGQSAVIYDGEVCLGGGIII